jgi:diguanylate cyclase (GGDEF)-like protein/PAS domain S-box-containing protein
VSSTARSTFFPDPGLRRGLSRVAEPHILFPIIAAILLGVVWGTTLSLIRVERAAADRAAATTTLELAETYEAQVVRSLREIDQTLKFVKYAHESQRGRLNLAELKAKGLLPPDLIFVVSIADATGEIVASSRALPFTSVADRRDFEQLRVKDTISVSKPTPSSVANEWRLHFSRRLNAPDGSFAGAVTVSVPAAYFVSGYEQQKLGNAGLLALVGTDGVFRARRTGESLSFGDRASYGAAVPQGSDTEPVVTASPGDGIRRYTSARELFDFPLAAIVGLSEEEQLAATNQRATAYLWRAAGGSLVLVLFLTGLGFLSWQLSRTRARANRALREEIDIRRIAEAALNLRNRAIESSVNAILILDSASRNFTIEYANPAFERITGYSASEVNGSGIAFLLGEERDQPGMQEIELALRERREGHAVLRNFRKDGTLFWNEFYIAPVRGDDGEITHYVGVMNDVTEAKTYEGQLAHQANFDTLTGLANRNLLQDRLQQAIAAARRGGGTVATVVLDIDNFKLVNDSLGHNVGDVLLQRMASRLKTCVRESDTVARLSGDEFVLVLHNKTGSSAESDITQLIEKVLGAVSDPLILGGRRMRPTCSIGVSVYPQDGEDAATLLKNADGAMYRAKELGRDRFQFFTSDVHERIRRRMELESSLRQALDREEFEIHYQPQVELRTGKIVGAEALLRWRHPEKGLIGPSDFIGFAEETGLIVPIGEWVLERACAQNKAWQNAGLPSIPVAVNMSARQCEQRDLDRVIAQALASTQLAARYLELEITESISMANPEQSVPLMQRLKDTGVGLSIDDFGTGFSNLSYLKRFPVDRLKIDLSFVREITTDPGSLAISEAIITMSHSLNLQVVAEGVETQAQLDLLGARRCDLIQGYLFSPPVAADAFARMLGEDRRLPAMPHTPTHDAPPMLM